MADLLPSLPSIDLKRALAHVFPGFLLYIGLLMAIDVFLLGEDSDFELTTVLINPSKSDLDTLTSLILVGLFAGSVLGVMIDGIGHWVFEDRLFDRIVRNRRMSDSDSKSLKIEDAEDKAYRYWMKFHKLTYWRINPKGTGAKLLDGTLPNEGIDMDFPASPDYFYPFANKKDSDEDKIKLKDQLISDYYSYFEFYLNSSISVFLISLIFPLYSISKLDSNFYYSLFICAIIMAASILLFFSSLHTLADYKRARVFAIEAYLRKKQQDQ